MVFIRKRTILSFIEGRISALSLLWLRIHRSTVQIIAYNLVFFIGICYIAINLIFTRLLCFKRKRNNNIITLAPGILKINRTRLTLADSGFKRISLMPNRLRDRSAYSRQINRPVRQRIPPHNYSAS